MNQMYTLLAIDVARERTREADEQRLARQAQRHADRPSIVRRGLAHGLAAVSLGSAAVVRRLDDCVADDLGRSLAPSE